MGSNRGERVRLLQECQHGGCSGGKAAGVLIGKNSPWTKLLSVLGAQSILHPTVVINFPFYWVKKCLLHSTQVQGCISDPELKHPKGSNHLGLTDTGWQQRVQTAAFPKIIWGSSDHFVARAISDESDKSNFIVISILEQSEANLKVILKNIQILSQLELNAFFLSGGLGKRK